MLHSLTVKHHMAANLVTFTPDMDVLRAIHLLLEKGITGAPVSDNLGNVIGFLSERDCLKVAQEAYYHGEGGGKVKDYMTPDAITVDADQNILEVAKLFSNMGFKALPVMDDNRLVGSISRSDVLKAFQSMR